MSGHVLLNSLDELVKSNKMRGLLSILSFFHEFNKLKKTGSRMLNSSYYML